MSALIKPLRVAGITAPMLRPLPTIFTYARITAETDGQSVPALDDEYTANVQALADIVDRANREADTPREAWQGIIEHLISITDLMGADLATSLDKLTADLTKLHQEHGKNLRKAITANPDAYRDLYRDKATAKKLLVCYSDEPSDQAESLERKLRERCYYDYESVARDWSVTRTGEADLVVFAPSQRPIPDSILSVVEAYGMPLLILMGGDKADDMENMALMKSEYLYRRRGYTVLRTPFTPARLYSAIDSLYLRHLAGKLLALPDLQKAAAVISLEAVGEG
jgi:antirestriction protein